MFLSKMLQMKVCCFDQLQLEWVMGSDGGVGGARRTRMGANCDAHEEGIRGGGNCGCG